MFIFEIGGDQVDTKDRTKQKACLERYRRACYQILAVLHKAAPQVSTCHRTVPQTFELSYKLHSVCSKY